MAIVLENIKNRLNIHKKNQYRYMDYNDLAIGQIGVLLIDFLNNKLNNNEITKENYNKILNTLNIKESSDFIKDKTLLKECLVSIEFDKIEYNNEIIYPKEKLKYLDDISSSLKKFYNKKENKHIYPNQLIKEIFYLYEIASNNISDLLNFETFSQENNKVKDVSNEFLKYVEDELIYTTINATSPRYDINSIFLNKEYFYLNISELKQLAPILINGSSLVWNKFENSGLTSSKLDIRNIDLDNSIKMLTDISYTNIDQKSFKEYTYQYLNDKLDLDKQIFKLSNLLEDHNVDKNELINTTKLYILKNMLEINALGGFLLNNNISNSYKKNLLVELNKLNKIKEISSDKLIENITKINNNLNSIMESFRNQDTSINITINDNNIYKSFSFESNYYLTKSLLEAMSKKDGLSLLLPGPPDFGKSHSTNEFVELFGGTVIKQEHIMVLSALSGTFEKGSANFDPNKRTHPLTELQISVINGEYNDGLIHMEEGARTFLEQLGSKVNTPNESTLLSALEPMVRTNTYWKKQAYGKEVKLYPSEYIKFVWSTNFIPKNIPNEIQVRFNSIPMDFSTISNFNSLNNIINNMLFKMNVEREINNFSMQNNSIRYVKMIQTINSNIIESFNSFKLDDLYNKYKNSNDFATYSESLSNQDKLLINQFLVENRINPYLVFKAKDKIEKIIIDLQNVSKNYNGDLLNVLNSSLKHLRISNAIENCNKEFSLNIDPNLSIKQYGLSIDAISKSFESKGIEITDSLQRFYSMDAYFMTIINEFKFLNEIKLDLRETKSIVNNDSDLLSSMGEYIKDDIDFSLISGLTSESNILLFNKIKEDYLKFVSNYNSTIANEYKSIVKSYDNKYAITPFKSSDAPIIGFEKMLKSINGLIRNKGFIDEELYKKMTLGTDLNKVNALLEESDVFVKTEIEDIGLGG